MARKEKELHLQLYPGWSARDNYAVHAKKKKRKKDPMPGEKGTRPDDRFMDNPAFGKYQGRGLCMPRHSLKDTRVRHGSWPFVLLQYLPVFTLLSRVVLNICYDTHNWIWWWNHNFKESNMCSLSTIVFVSCTPHNQVEFKSSNWILLLSFE